MYYIVFLKKFKKNVIVPKTWIKDLKKHKEKFMDSGLNRNQTYVCFYTKDPLAFDPYGLPIKTFPADFDLPLSRNLNNPGRYHVQLRKYRRK